MQLFYFDSKKFLQRSMDYETDFMGGVGSQYCFDYKDLKDWWFLPVAGLWAENPLRRFCWRQVEQSLGTVYFVKVTNKDRSAHENGE